MCDVVPQRGGAVIREVLLLRVTVWQGLTSSSIPVLPRLGTPGDCAPAHSIHLRYNTHTHTHSMWAKTLQVWCNLPQRVCYRCGLHTNVWPTGYLSVVVLCAFLNKAKHSMSVVHLHSYTTPLLKHLCISILFFIRHNRNTCICVWP